jgi:hypothetical protein
MRLGYGLRASLSMTRHPREGLERLRGRADRRRDLRELAERGVPAAQLYHPVAEWGGRFHAELGMAWPCGVASDFEQRWQALVDEITATGARFGRASYAKWSDGDVAMAALIWCVLAHERPTTVLETGVAHGVTSRLILEGLEANGGGHLSSVDLPAVDSGLHAEIGLAVPAWLRPRWTYVEGTSRARLPALVRQLGEVDLFVHDSLHTSRNMRMELATVWPALRPGGMAVVDDIDHSLGFLRFVDAEKPRVWFTAHHLAGHGLFGVAIKG